MINPVLARALRKSTIPVDYEVFAPYTCGRLAALISLRQPTARAAPVRIIGRSVPLPVALGGDDYAFVPPAAPSSSTDRLSISFLLNPLDYPPCG